ncbi:NAD(P)/FAD-dependent oxidoreductase [Nocardia sp. NPDC088792]|uniref:NAD(P)/FAD-dependent oxidoreductase n=1 Tax=Nocardia sp. NPDC088792 TaxID=3364332 RepID=UPI00381C1CC2
MSGTRVPERVVVVGAGIVGLSCAWSLQEHGVEVEVLDKAHPGAGASWGNAGYLTPSLTVPLPEPSLLRYGIRAVLDPRSPVRLPPSADPELARFLLRMIRHCTGARWARAMAIYRELNAQIFTSFDRQWDGGVPVRTAETDVIAAYTDAHQAAGLLHEFEGIVASGQEVDMRMLTGDQVRALRPQLSGRIDCGVRILGQRYLDPVAYLAALADSVRARGAKLTEDAAVTAVERRAGKVIVSAGDTRLEADAVVLANGAWLPELARPHGVRMPQYGGRGYSCSVAVTEPLRGPLYFPATRAALTPRGDRIRVVGVMEFQRPGAPLNRARIETTLRAIRPLLDGVDWADVREEWVGARPLTADGLPLIGATATEGVFIAGGHGMWGVTLGPLTGHLLAELMCTGTRPRELAALDPLR